MVKTPEKSLMRRNLQLSLQSCGVVVGRSKGQHRFAGSQTPANSAGRRIVEKRQKAKGEKLYKNRGQIKSHLSGERSGNAAKGDTKKEEAPFGLCNSI